MRTSILLSGYLLCRLAYGQAGVGFAAAVNYGVGSAPGAVVVGDFNRDGKPDLATANRGTTTVTVMLGKGDGTFQAGVSYDLQDYPHSLAVGDFNGDGTPDLAVVASGLLVLLGNGDGSFRTPAYYLAGSVPYALAIADFNGDGKADVVAINPDGHKNVLLGNGDGSFQSRLESFTLLTSPIAVAAGDFNGDGKVDLAVANGLNNNISVFLGNGDGTFQAAVKYPVGTYPIFLSVGDFNGDGNADLAVANDNSSDVSILLGNGAGTFSPAVSYAAGLSPSSVAVSDVNADGKADLVVSNWGGNSLSVLLGNGDGTFQAPASHPVGSNPSSVAVADFNRDGRADLAVANYSSDSVSILLGVGPQALRFVPVTPCRIADTRKANGDFGGPQISAGTFRSFVIPNSSCGIPANAQAYSLNVAVVVPAGRLGFLTAWPTGQPQPLASTLNSLDGRIKSNAAIVPAGTAGAISIYASDSTHVILDINGYFVAATDPTALAFYPVIPCRIADTRKPIAPLAGPSLAGNQNRTFPILSSACNIPSSAQAYSLNFAAIPPGPLGYLTAWPTGQTRPVVASLNAPTGAVTANAAIVPAGSSGSIDVFASNDTNLVIDINGYFAPTGNGGLSLYNITPCRVLDSRQPAGATPFSGQRTVDVAASPCGIPAAAQAHVFSATVVPSGGLGYLTLWAQGQSQPVVATLNALDGAITSNLAIVPANNGSISAWMADPSHLILDIFGYFAQ